MAAASLLRSDWSLGRVAGELPSSFCRVLPTSEAEPSLASYAMPDALPGLVICRVCFRAGPSVVELFAFNDELEAEAPLKAGWTFRNGWVCRQCLEEP